MNNSSQKEIKESFSIRTIDRKPAQYAKDFYRQLFNCSGDPIIITKGTERRIIEVNPSAIDFFQTPEEYLKDSLLESICERINRKPGKSFMDEKNMRENQAIEGSVKDFRIERPDGSVVIAEIKSSQIPSGAGLMEMHLFRDITFYHQADINKQLIISILEKSTDFIGVANSSKEAVYVNPAGLSMLGINCLHTAKKTKIEDYFFPEDLKFLKEEILPNVMQSGSWRGEIRLKHFKTGQPVFVDYALFLTEDPITGEARNFSTITRDIGNQKRIAEALQLTKEELRSSKASYDNILNNTKESIVFISPDLEIINFNKTANNNALKVFGKEMKLGADFKEFVADGTLDDFLKSFNAAMKGKRVVVERPIPTPAGDKTKDTWFEFAYSPVCDTDGLIIGIAFNVRNIDERVNSDLQALEKIELEKKITIQEESLKFKQNFLANMSHEIRTPLTGILGMAEILDKTKLSDEQTDYVNTIRQSCESLRGIINDVLDFSKIEAGKYKLVQREFQWRETLSTAEKLFKSICRKPIDLEIICDPEIPKYLKADENRIVQVVNNFLSNAIKFTDKGLIQLTSVLSGKATPAGKITVKVSVKDTGIGIPEQKLSQLFMPFSQIEDTDTRTFEGTGLGLSICKKLVEMHGGQIGVNSEPGKGSTFWFTFEAEEVSEESQGLLQSIELQPTIKNLRVLLAEDKAINQKVISLILESLKHQITIADNGRELLRKYKPGHFDLLLVDIQMPVMDGISAVKHLRKSYKQLPPIVGLSANAFEGDREKYMALGLDDYLPKPFIIKEFIRVLENVFQSHAK